MYKIKIISLIITLLILNIFTLHAGTVKYNNAPEKFKVFNKKSKKIITYYMVKPGKLLSVSTKRLNDISILSRVFTGTKNKINSYSYSVNFNNSLNSVSTVTKLVKPSSSTYGLGGETISAFNKYKIDLKVYNRNSEKISKEEGKKAGKFKLNSNLNNKLVIKNLSNYTILYKITSKDIIRSKKDIVEYIHFTPNIYNEEIEITNGEKKYNYFTSSIKKEKDKLLSLQLEGPVILKIVSRMLFSDDKNFTESSGYEYNILNNDSMLVNFNEKCIKSRKTTILGNNSITPSRGTTNIIKLEKGIHNITIEAPNPNRDLAFRFYINKKAISMKNNK